MSLTDYYEVLQISPNAEPETIHRVFRMLAMRFHPDNPETGDSQRFLELNRAYEVLSDPDHLRQHLLHHVARDVGEPEIAAHVVVGQARVVQAQAVQHGRLQVVHVDLVFEDVEAEVVRLARPPARP